MELIWKELAASRLVAEYSEQVTAEGYLPSPDGRTPAEALIVSPKAVILSSSVDGDGLHVAGRITVTLTAADPAGGLFAYESSAAFKRDAPIEGAAPGMNAEVNAQVVGISAVPDGDGVRMEAQIELSGLVVSNVPVKTAEGISGIRDLETKAVSFEHRSKRLLGSLTSRMREEIAAENVSDVIAASSAIAVRDASLERGTATVSGTITVSAVTLDADGRPGQMFRQVPFRERIEVNGSSDKVYCEAELGAVYLRALGEEFALISMETEAEFKVYGAESVELTVPVDAFSPAVGFDCLHDEIKFLSRVGHASAQSTVRETVPLPDGAADAASVSFAAARSVVTGVCAERGELNVEGVNTTTVVYSSSAGARHTFTEDVPFSISIPIEDISEKATVSTESIVSIIGFTERSVILQYNIFVEAELMRVDKVSAVSGITEKDGTGRKPGIAICFASEGEEVFDVAKRYSVPCALVEKLNPDVKAPFTEGDRLLLLI